MVGVPNSGGTHEKPRGKGRDTKNYKINIMSHGEKYIIPAETTVMNCISLSMYLFNKANYPKQAIYILIHIDNAELFERALFEHQGPPTETVNGHAVYEYKGAKIITCVNIGKNEIYIV